MLQREPQEHKQSEPEQQPLESLQQVHPMIETELLAITVATHQQGTSVQRTAIQIVVLVILDSGQI